MFKRRTGNRIGLFGATVNQGELSFSKKLELDKLDICASEDKTKKNDSSFKTINAVKSIKKAKKSDNFCAKSKTFATTDINQVEISPLKSQSNKKKSESSELKETKLSEQ